MTFQALSTSPQFWLLIIALPLLLFSLISFEILQNKKISLIILFVGGFCLCSFMAFLDPFLNSWDEQFHALVAKNLLSHPFTPTLFNNPVLRQTGENWVAGHIWLHKQPLFLWQMALSMELFGFSEFALRLPSVVMMSVLPLFTFRIGKICMNERIGFYGALLCASAFYVHELVTGFPPSEHNDVAFLFYVTASIWSYFEHKHSGKKRWLVLTGVFSGCAVLVKWLVGLLVFSGWAAGILAVGQRRTTFNSYKPLLVSLCICILTFLPWQLYILSEFPVESRHEYSLNSKHFFEVVEGHGGDIFYYFENFRITYGGGQLVPVLMICSLFFLYRNVRQGVHRATIFSIVLITYLFFSLAATKMPNFCYIVSPLLFLSLASLIHDVFEFIHVRFIRRRTLQKFFAIAALSAIAWANLDLYKIAYKHTMLIRPDDNDKRAEKIGDAAFMRSLSGHLPSTNYVIFNCKQWKNIAMMYYTSYTAYDGKLQEVDYLMLKKKGTKMAVIDNGQLPEFLRNDAEIIKIPAPDRTWR